MGPRLIPAALACAILLGGTPAPAQDSQPAPPTGSLIDAQRALRAAEDELGRARRAQSRAEDKAAEAKRDYADAQKELEQARTRMEQANQAAEAAKATTGQAQRKFDSARGVIERFYDNRQQ